MNSKPISSGGVLDRNEIRPEEAFQVVTAGGLMAPNALQQALFPRLTTQDTALLIPTGPCAGRLEAIAIPAMVAMRLDETAHRFFVIGCDGCPLDDYMYRLSPYVRSLVIADGVPRSIWFEEPERTPIARKYLPDGTHVNGPSDSPFNEEVDIVVMPFTHFRTVFFGAGGVHGVPEGIGFDPASSEGSAPRGLFYFDEAYGSTRAQYREFIRMVEFLFAQDLDIVVGGSTLPDSAKEELAFLEYMNIDEVQAQPNRSIVYRPAGRADFADIAACLTRETHDPAARVIVALNDPEDERIPVLRDALAGATGTDIALYRTVDSRAERGSVYARLREIEIAGGGYVAVTDGPALEVSDLDASTLICEPCSPLSLLRRAGRCNRRKMVSNASIHIIGDAVAATTPSVADVLDSRSSSAAPAYEGLAAPTAFDAAFWRGLLS
jgi:CRISPR-associated endonuclease/helicase Cas3